MTQPTQSISVNPAVASPKVTSTSSSNNNNNIAVPQGHPPASTLERQRSPAAPSLFEKLQNAILFLWQAFLNFFSSSQRPRATPEHAREIQAAPAPEIPVTPQIKPTPLTDEKSRLFSYLRKNILQVGFDTLRPKIQSRMESLKECEEGLQKFIQDLQQLAEHQECLPAIENYLKAVTTAKECFSAAAKGLQDAETYVHNLPPEMTLNEALNADRKLKASFPPLKKLFEDALKSAVSVPVLQVEERLPKLQEEFCKLPKELRETLLIAAKLSSCPAMPIPYTEDGLKEVLLHLRLCKAKRANQQKELDKQIENALELKKALQANREAFETLTRKLSLPAYDVNVSDRTFVYNSALKAMVAFEHLAYFQLPEIQDRVDSFFIKAVDIWRKGFYDL